MITENRGMSSACECMVDVVGGSFVSSTLLSDKAEATDGEEVAKFDFIFRSEKTNRLYATTVKMGKIDRSTISSIKGNPIYPVECCRYIVTPLVYNQVILRNQIDGEFQPGTDNYQRHFCLPEGKAHVCQPKRTLKVS